MNAGSVVVVHVPSMVTYCTRWERRLTFAVDHARNFARH